MPYIPYHIRLLDALEAALKAGMNAELAEVGQAAIPDSAFLARQPQLTSGESVAVLYESYDPDLMAKHWTDLTVFFQVHLTGFDPVPQTLNRRLMNMEFAVRQILSKANKRDNLGGLTRAIFVGTSAPWKTDWKNQSPVYDMLLLPIACQPNERVPNPERSLP
jgi:hypothetical protein